MPTPSAGHKFTNHLVHETSPYLLQHAHNPVDWHPWGSQALDRARQEDKPIFLSIGYAACHWCHVMERESFENEEIARILDSHFISVKVDREERPDLDEIYMTATQMVTGSGGWPMSVWLTPDLQPFYAGTYFPPDDRWGRPGFARILLALAEAFEKDRGKVEQSARNIAESVERILAADGSSSSIGDGLVEQTVDAYTDRFDPLYGGFGGAPKFPHSMDLMLLLRAYRRDDDDAKWKMIEVSLDKMARGGMYDQLGGGFHRYSVDDKWLIPHFEKMLYDNALLARTYLEAFQSSSDEFQERVARETLDYIIREMQSPEGGYYSSTDADSEGEEGRFFVWSPSEIQEILGEADAAILCEYYDVREAGNFEHTGKSVLSIPRDATEVAARMGVSGERLWSVIERSKPKLLAERAKRIPPALDDKILTDWNGLMIGSMAFGGFVLNEPRYIESASRAAVAILEHQWDGERLLHTRRAGRSHLDGMLADYAAMASGLYELYRATQDPRWLRSAANIHHSMTAQFEDKERGGFFNTLDGKSDLLLRSKSATDNAVPSGNSLAALNAVRLGALLGDPRITSQGERTFLAFGQALRQSGSAFPQMLIALDYFQTGGEQLILVPGDAKEHAGEFIDPLREKFTPYLEWMEAGREGIEQISPLLEGKKAVSGRNTAYLCRGNTCLPPVTSAKDLLNSMGAR